MSRSREAGARFEQLALLTAASGFENDSQDFPGARIDLDGDHRAPEQLRVNEPQFGVGDAMHHGPRLMI